MFSLNAVASYSSCHTPIPLKISPPDTTDTGFFDDESFTLGAGVSYFFDSGGEAPNRSIIGYYGTFSIEKKLFQNFVVSSGIDGYNVPRSNTKLIGNITLGVSYEIPLGDKIIIRLNTGLFTGFIHRRNSSGINSGALIGSTLKYKINKKYDAGINIKYPFFTEVTGVYLVNGFFTF